MVKSLILYLSAAFLFLMPNLFAQQKMDEEYGKLIQENTTDAKYLNELVDHLPASDQVPSPLQYFGSIIGAENALHYTAEIHEYMEKLAETSPRVKVENIGKSEEGRDMKIVFIGSSEAIQNLDEYAGYLNKLSDPRITDKQEAERLIEKAKPIYYFTAGIHSPETSNPEMVMELAYRLAVSEEPNIKAIRDRVIVAITPVVEVDGRDRVVDIYRWREENNEVTPELSFWGHYVAHDNNRDGYGLLLNLTNNVLQAYLKYKPTVLHDLHESVPFLYPSTGTGPYNPFYDATLVDDWHKISYNDVDELTRRDMPGVWTHGYYSGWGFNYLFSIGNVRNSIGRFYETFGNSVPQTLDRDLGEESPFSKQLVSTEWYRPNPPLNKTKWSFRNSMNYSQSGALSSLTYVANNKETLLHNFYRRGVKGVEMENEKKPYAYVLPKKQRRYLSTVDFVNFFKANGVEVHQTDQTLKVKGKTISGGAYVIRMDQPYSLIVSNFMERLRFPSDRYSSFDDTGWTLTDLRQIEAYRAEDAGILNTKMTELTAKIDPKGSVEQPNARYLLLNNSTDNQIATFRLNLKDIPMQIAEDAFQSNGKEYASGSLIINFGALKQSQKDELIKKAEETGLRLFASADMPKVAAHEAKAARVAILFTWMPTPQNAGWWRAMFDKYDIPYDLVATQDLKNLKPGDYNVMILPDSRASTSDLINGADKMGPKIPWKNSKLTPNLGKIASTDDQREGMGYDGLRVLREFVEQGGVLITDDNSAQFPIEMGFTKNVEITSPKNLKTAGSVFQATNVDKKSPITYGIPDTLGVYFSQTPVLKVNDRAGAALGRRALATPQWLKDDIWNSTFPRTVLSFSEDKDKLLLSGILESGEELAGTPAVIDAPFGKGHVILFAIHPFWRGETYASHTLVFNTILNWDALRTEWPEQPQE